MITSGSMRWGGLVASMNETRSKSKHLFERSHGDRPFGRCRCGWEDNIKMDFSEVHCKDMKWT
jgi:hypothetical protein